MAHTLNITGDIKVFVNNTEVFDGYTLQNGDVLDIRTMGTEVDVFEGVSVAETQVGRLTGNNSLSMSDTNIFLIGLGGGN